MDPPAVMLYLRRSSGQRLDRMETRLREDLKRLDKRVGRLEHSKAKLEGFLEGLRVAVTRRSVA